MKDRRAAWIALALAALCAAVYWRAAWCGFLNYDDNGYVTGNPWVRGGITAAGVRWAFTTVDYYYWQPLTWLSHMIDCQLFGVRPGGPHVVSVGFHIANTLLLFAILRRLTGAVWRSAAAAAIFAVHPLRVESVVWIAERKDLLSGLFFLAAIWLYLNYVERPGRGRYYLVIAAFAAGLMAKPMIMTLPVLLLLLDWWPLKRRAVAEKVPMFALAVLSALVTSVGTARLGAINWGSSVTWGQKIANTLVSYVRYLELTVWPHDLAILYPFRTSVPAWQAVGSALLLATITGAAALQARRRPYLCVGWLWFVLALAPASGLMQVGRQGMADRFTYLPHIGLIVAAVWAGAELLGRWRGLAAAAAVCALAVAAVAYVAAWRDSVALFTLTVRHTADNPGARHYLAAALDDAGRYAEALPHHAESVRLEPGYFVAQCSYAADLERLGQLQLAAGHYHAALRAFPNYPDAQQGLDRVQKLLDLSKASGFKLNPER